MRFPKSLRSFHARPPIDGAVLPARCGVLSTRLARQNSPVCYSIGVRPPYLATKKTREPGSAAKHILMLVVDVENIDLTRPMRQVLAPLAQKFPQQWRRKRIEKEDDTRALGYGEFRGVAAQHPGGRECSICCAPMRQILARSSRQRVMNLHANHSMKSVSAREEQGAAHAGSEIDKGILIERRDRFASAPAHDDRVKD